MIIQEEISKYENDLDNKLVIEVGNDFNLFIEHIVQINNSEPFICFLKNI